MLYTCVAFVSFDQQCRTDPEICNRAQGLTGFAAARDFRAAASDCVAPLQSRFHALRPQIVKLLNHGRPTGFRGWHDVGQITRQAAFVAIRQVCS